MDSDAGSQRNLVAVRHWRVPGSGRSVLSSGREGQCGTGMESVAARLVEGRRREADVYIAVLLLQHLC